MLNFGLKHGHNRTWHKKFPRQKIEREDPKHFGMTTHLRLRNEWREGRNGYLSYKEIRYFLKKHLGENVDKVFSEFVKRAKRYDHDENLKKCFYRELNLDKPWGPKYTLDSQKRIVKAEVIPVKKRITSGFAEEYNKKAYPKNINKYLNEVGLTYLGHFYIRKSNYGWELTPIYIVNKEWYNMVLSIGVGKEYVKYSNMSKVRIHIPKANRYLWSDSIVGVPKVGYDTCYVETGEILDLNNGLAWQKQQAIQVPYTFTYENADYIFLAKGFNWSKY
jgi:hypothetical protein